MQDKRHRGADSFLALVAHFNAPCGPGQNDIRHERRIFQQRRWNAAKLSNNLFGFSDKQKVPIISLLSMQYDFLSASSCSILDHQAWEFYIQRERTLRGLLLFTPKPPLKSKENARLSGVWVYAAKYQRTLCSHGDG